jgi:hypothetical protein
MNLCGGLALHSPSLSTGDLSRQQAPYCCQSRPFQSLVPPENPATFFLEQALHRRRDDLRRQAKNCPIALASDRAQPSPKVCRQLIEPDLAAVPSLAMVSGTLAITVVPFASD